MNDQPQHSSDTYMADAEPVQTFVSPPREVSREDLARPRHGRPAREATDRETDSPPRPASVAG